MRRLRSRGVFVTVAAALVVALAVVAFLNDRASSAREAESAAVRTADEAMTQILSYTPDDVESGVDDDIELLTDGFAREYRDLMAGTVIPAAREDDVTTEAVVVQAGLVDRDGDSAEVLLFVNLSTTTGDEETPSARGSRVKVQLDRVDGDWKIAQFNPL